MYSATSFVYFHSIKFVEVKRYMQVFLLAHGIKSNKSNFFQKLLQGHQAASFGAYLFGGE